MTDTEEETARSFGYDEALGLIDRTAEAVAAITDEAGALAPRYRVDGWFDVLTAGVGELEFFDSLEPKSGGAFHRLCVRELAALCLSWDRRLWSSPDEFLDAVDTFAGRPALPVCLLVCPLGGPHGRLGWSVEILAALPRALRDGSALELYLSPLLRHEHKGDRTVWTRSSLPGKLRLYVP